METQRSRDDKTVAIATALAIFGTLLVVGYLLLWGITSALDVSDHRTSPMFIVIIAASAMATVVYLVRIGRQ